jgi:hypothetical protein
MYIEYPNKERACDIPVHTFLHDDNPVDGENQLRNISGILEEVELRLLSFWIIIPKAFNRLSMRKQSI